MHMAERSSGTKILASETIRAPLRTVFASVMLSGVAATRTTLVWPRMKCTLGRNVTELELLDGAVMAINAAEIDELAAPPFEIGTGYPMKTPLDTQPLQMPWYAPVGFLLKGVRG